MKWRLKRCLSGLWKFRELTKEEIMNKKELNKIIEGRGKSNDK